MWGASVPVRCGGQRRGWGRDGKNEDVGGEYPARWHVPGGMVERTGVCGGPWGVFL